MKFGYSVVVVALLFQVVAASLDSLSDIHVTNKLKFSWTSTEILQSTSDPSTNGTLEEKIYVNATVELAHDSWLGFGIVKRGASHPHDGARVLIGRALGPDRFLEYYETTSPPDTDLVEISAWSLGATFERTESVSTLRVSFNQSRAEAQDVSLMFAYGASDRIAYHGRANRYLLAVDLLNGTSSMNDSLDMDYRVLVHVLCMSAAFALFIPAAVVSAAGKPLNGSKAWLRKHKMYAFLGLSFAGTGLGMIVWYVEDWQSNYHFSTYHHFAGFGLMGLLVVNPFVGMLKPESSRGEPKSCSLKTWQVFHRGMGYLVLIGGLGNVAWGAFDTLPRHYPASILNVFQWSIPVSVATFVAMGISGGLLVIVIFAAIVLHYRKRKVKKLMKASQVSLTRYSRFTLRNNRRKGRPLKDRNGSSPALHNISVLKESARKGSIIAVGGLPQDQSNKSIATSGLQQDKIDV